MTLPELSIKKPVFAWMLMFGLIIFGGISFLRMGVSQMPDIDFPVVTVSLTYRGAAPEVMEADIVNIVEDAVMGVDGVQSVTSSCFEGSANISVQFDLKKNIDVAMQEIQNRITQAQRLLPRDMDPPVISKTNPEDQPILWIALQSDSLTPRQLMSYTNDYLKDQFTSVPGVGNVFLGGYVDPNLRVWVHNKALKQYNLTISDVINAVQNEHVELPAGYIDDPTQEKTVRAMGEAKTVDQFEQIRLNTRAGQPNYNPITIKNVADIEDGLADIRRISRSNGALAVGLGIVKQRGTNAVEVANAVKKRLEQVRKVMPKGMRLEVRNDSTRFIKQSVNELVFNLLLSALLTGIVCWVFLGSWSATVNVLLAIPTSVVGAFIVLYFAGFTLNSFTLLALSLSIGIVVDDSIMVLENIVRHREMGQSKHDAALNGANQIFFAALATSVAIVAIFLPVAFMNGIIGKFFYQFGVTMAVAVSLSLLEAVTLTPMRCAQFVEVGERTTRFGKAVEAGFHGAAKAYRGLLEKGLRHPWLVLLGSLVLFFGSCGSLKFLRKEFMPAQDMSMFLMRLQGPAGSSLANMDAKTKIVEQYLMSRPEVDGYFCAVGGFGNGGQVSSSNVFVSLKDRGKRGIDPKAGHELSQAEIMDLCRAEFKKIPNLTVYIQDLSMRGFASSGFGFPIEFTVRGTDWNLMGQYANQIMDEMKKTGLMTDVGTDYLLGQREVDVVPDRVKAAQRGVEVQAIAQTVQAAMGGVQPGKYENGGNRYDITVELANAERNDPKALKDLFVRNNRGEVVPLLDVAKVEERPALQSITRMDRERAISIWANVAKGASQQDCLQKVQAIADKILPVGYHIVMIGNAQAYKDAMFNLIFALLLGIAVAYMVLASQFNSFIDPVTVLMALPFSASGAFLFLLLFNQSVNMYSMIGLILLMGIVKKNSILLVDFTNHMREQGMSPTPALLEACPIRLRPILMTSFAIIAASVPEAFALGPGAEIVIPMAVSVIGGVLVSTVLTLFVVPCVYLLFTRFEKRAHQTEANSSLNGGGQGKVKLEPVVFKKTIRRRS